MTPDLKELEQSTETIVLNALNRAYQLGQTYWQQADSESYSQNAKSDVTAEKFRQLRDETRISVCGLEVENFTLRSGTGHLGGLYASPPSAVPVVEQLVEASTMLLSYTLACEGLLNAKPAGQIDIAQEAIAAGQKFIKENGK